MVRWAREIKTELGIKNNTTSIMIALGGVIRVFCRYANYATFRLVYMSLLHLMKMESVIVAACSRRGEINE